MTLCTMVVNLLFEQDSILVNITDYILSRLIYFTLPHQNFCPVCLVHLHVGYHLGQCHVLFSHHEPSLCILLMFLHWFHTTLKSSASLMTLCTMLVNLLFEQDSILVNITDFILSRLIYFTLTTSKLLSCLSCSSTCGVSSWPMLCTLFTPWAITLHPADVPALIPHHLKVIQLPAPATLLTICQTLSVGCLMLRYLQLCSFLSTLGVFYTCLFVCHLMISKFFVSFISWQADVCSHCTSTLHAQSKKCSLVVSSMFSSMAVSLRISSTIP